jgi:hypothetical protein
VLIILKFVWHLKDGAGCVNLLFETISDPDFIIKGKKGELLAYRLYNKTHISKKYVIVVYKEINDDGFVITTLMSSKEVKMDEVEILWKKI